ncbi:MAG: hypothetical protein M4579_003182 [Chaenotheca gracillima]|nr:MAG: hypothetical protein M4579_003182 [Chaenotheca gracillima]
MVARKRGRQEMEAGSTPQEPPLIDRIRNMWEFANLGQYLFTFGKAVRLDEDLSIEVGRSPVRSLDLVQPDECSVDADSREQDLETECLKPEGHSQRLTAIGLALLKFVSSHRGLTPDMFDEYTRRQYESKLPTRNPFGTEETPKSFTEFDVLLKIRVLYQLSQWTMVHSERIRERMPEQKDTEQSYWRVEPTGWDADERTYYVLDDNRLYRCTDPEPPPPPAPKPKKNSKKAKQMARAANKRRKLSGAVHENGDEEEENQAAEVPQPEEDGFGGKKWECVAVTLDQYRHFLDRIRRTKNPNEKILYQQVADNVLPIVEKAEEEQQRKIAKRQKELLNLEKMATAKRSSRIAGKAERQKEEEEAIESEKKRQADLLMAKKEQERLKKMEREREERIMTREHRVKERETRRILHEEELANLSEDSKKLQAGEGRVSERHLHAEMERRKKALEELEQENDWMFDCSGCGVHGENLDDGTGIIACEKCSVWQHLACLGLTQEAAEQKDFHFVCNLCKRREEDKQKSVKNPIKLDFRKLGSSASPTSEKTERHLSVNGDGVRTKRAAGDERYSTSPSPKRSKFEETGYLESSRHSPKATLKPTNTPDSRPLERNTGSNLPNGAISSRATPQMPPRNGVQADQNTAPANGTAPSTSPANGAAALREKGISNSARSPFNSAPSLTRPSSSPKDGLGVFFNSFDRQYDPNTPRQGAMSPTKPSARLSKSPTLREQNKEMSPSPRVGFPQSGSSPNSVLAPPRPASPQPPGASISSPSPAFCSPSRSNGAQLPRQTASGKEHGPRAPTSPGSIFQSPNPNAHLSPGIHSPSTIPGANPAVASALPDPRSGLSPTKQASPPRPSGFNLASAEVATPIMHDTHPVLQPGPSLSPTARPVDLTPPRKAITPEQRQM